MSADNFNGIINILKPPGMTSFDVVGYLRGMLRIKRIGHTGTLDPAAVGVLPVCIGTATKAIEYMVDKDKLYRAELTLGIDTDTQDSTGEIIQQREVSVSEEKIREVINSFIGKYNQIPPMYSAVKIEGKKLYELAREGKTVERQPRGVEIYSIKIIDIKYNKIIMDVSCSKGTYIRTLCADIGERLGCGGHMSFLVRLKAGKFEIHDALTVEDVKELFEEGKLIQKIINVEKVFSDYKEAVLEQENEKRLMNGAPVRLEGNFAPGEMLRVFNNEGKFLALGELFSEGRRLILKSKKVF